MLSLSALILIFLIFKYADSVPALDTNAEVFSTTWINVSDWDISRIMDSLTSRTWSFFNVIIAFAWVIIVVWFIKLILRFVKKD